MCDVTEVGRFFDQVSYTESDQAEVQARFRGTGVVIEAGNRLLVGTPGGMFVSVDTGEALVEGFWYKNTALLNLAVASNTSGNTRIDVVVLRLDRTGNALSAAVVVGVAGAGTPTLTQVAGGVWEFPLATITVPTGTTGAITSVMLSDDRVYTIRTYMQYDPPTKYTYWAEPTAPSAPNILDNSAFGVNQRVATSTALNATYAVDRWSYNYDQAHGSVMAVNATPPGTLPTGILGHTPPASLSLTRTASTAIAASNISAITHVVEGVRLKEYGILGCNYLCLSFWAYATRVGPYSYTISQNGTNLKYFGTYNVYAANVWQYVHKIIPWNGSGTWLITNVASLTVQFLSIAASNYVGVVTDAWDTTATRYAPSNHVNLMATSGDTLHILEPKLEVGSVPTKWRGPAFDVELQKALRYLRKSYDYAVVPPTAAVIGMIFGGVVSSTGPNVYITVVLSPQMRTGPTVTVYGYNGGVGQFYNVNTGADASTLNVNSINTSQFTVFNTAIATSCYGFHYLATAEM